MSSRIKQLQEGVSAARDVSPPSVDQMVSPAWAARFDASSLEPAEVPAFTKNLQLLSQSGDPSSLRQEVDAQMLAATDAADLPDLALVTPSVFANGRSVLNSGDGGVNVAVLDVCKVPPTNVPVPFVNVAPNTNLAEVSSKLGADGEGVATVAAFVPNSTGDEPGVGGGILSGYSRGKMHYMSRSLNVRCGDEGMVRAFEITGHNGVRDDASYPKPVFARGGGFGGLSLAGLGGIGGLVGSALAGVLAANMPALGASLGALPGAPALPQLPLLPEVPRLPGLPEVSLPTVVRENMSLLRQLFRLGGGLATGSVPWLLVGRLVYNSFIGAQLADLNPFGLQSLSAMLPLPLPMPSLEMLPPSLAGLAAAMVVPAIPGVGLSGEPFNTISVAPGVPTNDETEIVVCPSCKKPEEEHEVGESEESKGGMSALTDALTQRFEVQRPLVEQFLALDAERTRQREALNDGAEEAEPPDPAQRKAALAELTAQQEAINEQLEAQGPVLCEDCDTGTYSQGFVVGVALCRCGKDRLAACTGPANPAFVEAVEQAGLTLLSSDSFEEEPECDCAAFKLLAKITGEGHRIKALSLSLFQPIPVGGEQEEAPSPQCPDCQDKLKTMLCNNDEPCPG